MDLNKLDEDLTRYHTGLVEMKTRVAEVKADMREEYLARVENLENMRDQHAVKYGKLKTSSGDVWEDLKIATEEVWSELEFINEVSLISNISFSDKHFVKHSLLEVVSIDSTITFFSFLLLFFKPDCFYLYREVILFRKTYHDSFPAVWGKWIYHEYFVTHVQLAIVKTVPGLQSMGRY